MAKDDYPCIDCAVCLGRESQKEPGYVIFHEGNYDSIVLLLLDQRDHNFPTLSWHAEQSYSKSKPHTEIAHQTTVCLLLRSTVEV